MEIETYAPPEMVEIGSAADLVQYRWSGAAVDILNARYECGQEGGLDSLSDCC